MTLTSEVTSLAAHCMVGKVVQVPYAEDADQVAVTVVHKMEMVVRGNFKHLVNAHREKGFDGANLLQG